MKGREKQIKDEWDNQTITLFNISKTNLYLKANHHHQNQGKRINK